MCSEDSDQTVPMCILIWVFAGCTSEGIFSDIVGHILSRCRVCNDPCWFVCMIQWLVHVVLIFFFFILIWSIRYHINPKYWDRHSWFRPVSALAFKIPFHWLSSHLCTRICSDKCPEISNTLLQDSFCLKFYFIRICFTKYFVEWHTGSTQNRPLQESDLGLSLHRPYSLGRNIRKCTLGLVCPAKIH